MEPELDIDRYQNLKRDIESIGEEKLDRCLELYNKLRDTFDEHRETAVGHGDFKSYIHVQDVLAEIEEELESSDDIHRHDGFREIIDVLDHRTIKEKHFSIAEDLMNDIEEDIKKLREHRELRRKLKRRLESNKKAIKKKQHRKNKLREHINRIEELPDIDTTEIIDTIDRYNELVEGDFQEFKQKNAVDVLGFLIDADKKPLLELEIPDGVDIDLLESSGLGDKNLDEILDVASYSEAKLSHYTDDPNKLKNSIPKRWLMDLDSRVFQVHREEDEDELRFKLPEIRRTIRGFASDEAMKELRKIERLVKKGNYSDMKRAVDVKKHSENGEVDEMKTEAKVLESEVSELREINSEIRDTLDA